MFGDGTSTLLEYTRGHVARKELNKQVLDAPKFLKGRIASPVSTSPQAWPPATAAAAPCRASLPTIATRRHVSSSQTNAAQSSGGGWATRPSGCTHAS